MKQTIYPCLRETVRIKKMNSFCWVSELLNDIGNKCTAKEAFILSLCNGEYDMKTIADIYAEVFTLDPEKAYDKVIQVVERFHVCLNFSDKISSQSTRYEPVQFVYNLSNLVDETILRFESPAEMSLELNKTCNFKCIYCYNSSSCDYKIEMSTEEWIKVIQEAKELDVIKCTLTGGEPFAHPGFFEILETLVKHGILTYICTNGSLIDEQAISKLKALNLPLIQVSLDSPIAEKHHTLTQTTDTFHKVTRAIQRLVEVGIKVYVKAVVLPETIEDIGELIDLCFGLGVSNLILDQYDLSYEGRGDNQFFLNKDQEKYAQKVVEEKREKIGKAMNINMMIGKRCWSNEKDIVRCGAFMYSFIIMTDGEYNICQKMEYTKDMSIGNHKTLSLTEMWSSSKIHDILNPPIEKVKEPCKSCDYFENCKTGCFAVKQFVTNEIYAADPRCWKADYSYNQFITG